MRDIERQLIEIVGEALFQSQGEPKYANSADWESLMKEAIQQAVFPIVFPCIEEKMPKNSMYENYKIKFLSYIRHNMKNLHCHNVLHQLLEENSIVNFLDN